MDKNYDLTEIKKAYEYLESVTPLKKDCGKLCGGKCCKGEAGDGMLLFPGEEILFENKSGFTVYFDERYSAYAVTCDGSCDRKNRPLSCRIFPYFIYMKDDSIVPTVAPDIRATQYCPLLVKGTKINKEFLRALRVTGRLLISDNSIREFLVKLTALMTDFNEL